MPYAGQAWTDGVTPLDSTHMSALDAGVVGAVDVDNVAVAAGQLVANKLLAADAQPAFKILGDGKFNWGPGGATAPDTDLYRNAPGVVRTSGSLVADQAISLAFARTLGSNALYTAAPGDGGYRFLIRNDGTLGWSNGSVTTPDTTLYRPGAANLKTDGSFSAGQSVVVDTTNAGNKLYLGGTLDTYLYRSAAGLLKTDGHFFAAKQIWAQQGTANQVIVGAGAGGGDAAGIAFGSAYDTNLYRSAAGTLKTDGGLNVVGDIQLNGAAILRNTSGYVQVPNPSQGLIVNGASYVDYSNGTYRLYFGSAGDTSLYRFVASTLKTDGALNVGAQVCANQGGASQILLWTDGKLYFGSANDTNLYRSAAGYLRTDGIFASGGTGTGQTQIGNVFNNGQATITFGSDGAATLEQPSGGGTHVYCANPNYGWGDLSASAFNVVSDRRLKYDGEPAEIDVGKLLAAGVYSYRRDKSDERHVGLYADELPAELIATAQSSADPEPILTVDLYKLTTALLATVQHLDGRIIALEAGA